MKVLVTLSRFPWPTDKGDKLRAWHQIQGLASKHEVYVFCLSDEPVSGSAFERLSLICKEVCLVRLGKMGIFRRMLMNLPGNRPFQVAYFNDSKARQAFEVFYKKIQPDVVYCQLARMAEFSRTLKDCVKVIDYQDAFSKGIERRIGKAPAYQRMLLREEYRRLKVYETQIAGDFSMRTIISSQDARLLGIPGDRSFAIIPNGVDTEHYMPEPGARSFDLLFTGNMQYEPNVNCVLYLVKQVFPLIEKELPHIQLVVAGKNPSRVLKKMANRQLHLTGWVDDLRTYYRQARIFVAPMQIGIGMQNKILEAMSMGMPVITSSLANNAIGAEHGKHLWVADHPQKVAEAIVYLLSNTEYAIQLGINARALMIERYSWQKQNKLLCELIEGKTSGSPEPLNEKALIQ